MAKELTQELQEDLRYGQIIITTVRWFLIAMALFISTYRQEVPLANVYLLFALTGFNAYLSHRAFTGKPLGRGPVLFASALDIAVITGLLAVSDTHFHNQFFIFYYFVLPAISMVFAPRITAIYTGAAVVGYTIVSFLPEGGKAGMDFGSAAEEKTLIARLVVMVATAVAGAYFYRVERRRRLDAVRAVQVQLVSLQQQVGATARARIAAQAGPDPEQEILDATEQLKRTTDAAERGRLLARVQELMGIQEFNRLTEQLAAASDPAERAKILQRMGEFDKARGEPPRGR